MLFNVMRTIAQDVIIVLFFCFVLSSIFLNFSTAPITFSAFELRKDSWL